MTFEQTVVIALCTALATATLTWLGHLFVAYLQRSNEQTKFFREKLHERYSEFVAIAAADIERAKSQAAGMVLGGSDQDYTELAKLDEKRHETRLDLLRISFQIQLLEQNIALTDKIQKLAKAQPFMVFPFPPQWRKGNYNGRFDKFEADTKVFETLLVEFIETVVATRSCRA